MRDVASVRELRLNRLSIVKIAYLKGGSPAAQAIMKRMGLSWHTRKDYLEILAEQND